MKGPSMVDNPAPIANISGETETDQAIATLVLAFSDDPVARWLWRATAISSAHSAVVPSSWDKLLCGGSGTTHQ